jgi:hypothetical protein
MVSERRLIPFLGAGFSASHDLPDWDALLQRVAKDLRIDATDPKMSYEELRRLGDGDFLRMAEYLYLRAGSAIGPLRYSMTNALHTDTDPLSSTPHVELVNLGCPQVYTTNFDELIESIYWTLEQPVEVVSLLRDVAKVDPTQTQVVKYHGDLRHDATLVVTESQYWKRLDFESPMDLKFRSDLLGRSVMFIGYSFRDINIRVIWFKLMQMMRDVPVQDRLPSYMIRFEPNPVLEALYEDVGLHTIALDPEGKAETSQDRTALLSEFLYTLASEASPNGMIPGSDTRMFTSDVLLERVETEISGGRPFFGPGPATGMLVNRQPPKGRHDRAIGLLEMVLRSRDTFVGPFIGWGLQWASHELAARPPLSGAVCT